MREFVAKNTEYMIFEPDQVELVRIAEEAGFQVEIDRQQRAWLISLFPNERRPMFFDAADPQQTSLLAAARTFVSGSTGAVFNTPFSIEPSTGPGIVVRLSTEIRRDQARNLPHGPTEASLVALFQQVVQDLAAGMVGVCGLPSKVRRLTKQTP